MCAFPCVFMLLHTDCMIFFFISNMQLVRKTKRDENQVILQE